jgi:hypothetical protein
VKPVIIARTPSAAKSEHNRPGPPQGAGSRTVFVRAHYPQPAGEQCLYDGNPEYGLAEALLLTDDQIWIGLDNNGKEAKGMLAGARVGTDPVVLVCKRPAGF